MTAHRRPESSTTGRRTPEGGGYREFLSQSTLSVGRFTADPGHEDSQAPHTEDEVYFVAAGAADLLINDARHHMTKGSVAYVPAGTPHRFTGIMETIEVLVFFAPGPNPDS